MRGRAGCGQVDRRAGREYSRRDFLNGDQLVWRCRRLCRLAEWRLKLKVRPVWRQTMKILSCYLKMEAGRELNLRFALA
jgi:hypothetical protein